MGGAIIARGDAAAGNPALTDAHGFARAPGSATLNPSFQPSRVV